MKIVIKNNASALYCASVPRHGVVNWNWYEMLKAIEGKTIEVETDYLFVNQYNTVPIPGVSDLGMRIMDRSVERVIDDTRHRYKNCSYCGKKQGIRAKKCRKCGKTDFNYLTLKQIIKHKAPDRDYNNFGHKLPE